MDALLALMSEDFHQSAWTDQEVGVAIGRGVPVIPVRRGTNPYGFIGKYQALRADKLKPKEIASKVFDLLWTKPQIADRLTEALVYQFENADNFYNAEDTFCKLEKMTVCPEYLISRIEAALEGNDQVAGTFAVQRRMRSLVQRLRNNSG